MADKEITDNSQKQYTLIIISSTSKWSNKKIFEDMKNKLNWISINDYKYQDKMNKIRRIWEKYQSVAKLSNLYTLWPYSQINLFSKIGLCLNHCNILHTVKYALWALVYSGTWEIVVVIVIVIEIENSWSQGEIEKDT